MKTLNKKEIDKHFKLNVLPNIMRGFETDGVKDKPARSEAYNNFIDMLQKGGQITEKQANKYSIPKHLIK